MACKCAPSLLQLRAEVNARWPDRDQASDGCCASSSHSKQNPTSDHEPAQSGVAKGLARALDVDEDLTPNGPGPDDLELIVLHLFGATAAEAEPRCKYMIYAHPVTGRPRIFYPHDGAKKRGEYPYGGSNPHDKHAHFSIFDWAVGDTSPWFAEFDKPDQEVDMPPSPAVVYDNDGTRWVFVRGTNAALYAKKGTAGFVAVGGTLTSGPTATVRPDGQIDVIVRGGEAPKGVFATYLNTLDPVNGSWSGWSNLGGNS